MRIDSMTPTAPGIAAAGVCFATHEENALKAGGHGAISLTATLAIPTAVDVGADRAQLLRVIERDLDLVEARLG